MLFLYNAAAGDFLNTNFFSNILSEGKLFIAIVAQEARVPP